MTPNYILPRSKISCHKIFNHAPIISTTGNNNTNNYTAKEVENRKNARHAIHLRNYLDVIQWDVNPGPKAAGTLPKNPAWFTPAISVLSLKKRNEGRLFVFADEEKEY